VAPAPAAPGPGGGVTDSVPTSPTISAPRPSTPSTASVATSGSLSPDDVVLLPASARAATGRSAAAGSPAVVGLVFPDGAPPQGPTLGLFKGT
jgi:hypothetical protein